jgi:methyl-accepting chemotaxis protein
MQFFSNLSIAKRLYLLNLVAAIGLIILSAITIYQATHDLKAQADSELKYLTETVTTLIAGYHERAKSDKMTEAQAKTAAAAAVSKIRYEGKGFSVVATVVKSLADQTAPATEEIGAQV